MDKKLHEIKLLFEKNPRLGKLLPNPIVVNDSSFTKSIINQISTSFGNIEKDDLYRLVFKNNSSRTLMTINNGELKGLPTAISVEKGKIHSHVGLEKVELDQSKMFLPTLLTLSMYASIKSQLSYLSHIVTDIRNHQLIQQQAKFERITEILIDSFNNIPTLAIDMQMRNIYLSRVINNNDDCLEVFITQREDLKTLLKSEPEYHSTGFGYLYWEDTINGRKIYYPDRFFEHTVLTHPIFSVFERLVAGRICEIVISGNYSDDNIRNHKAYVTRQMESILDLLNRRLEAFDNFKNETLYKLNREYDLTSDEKNDILNQLKAHDDFHDRIINNLNKQLNQKVDSFDILKHLTNQDEIELIYVDGLLIMNSDRADA